MRPRWALIALCVAGCGAKDHSGDPIDVAAWKQAHGTVAAAFKKNLDAIVDQVKTRPAITAHSADPATPFKFQRDTTPGWEDTVYFSGVDVPGMPEYGLDKGKSVEDWQVSVHDWQSNEINAANVYALLDGKQPAEPMTQGAGEALAHQLEDLRYVLLLHVLHYAPGAVDYEGGTFNTGRYEGAAYVFQLDGAKLLASIAVAAHNSNEIESSKGNAKALLMFDLEGEAMKAFRAGWEQVLPKFPLPPKAQ